MLIATCSFINNLIFIKQINHFLLNQSSLAKFIVVFNEDELKPFKMDDEVYIVYNCDLHNSIYIDRRLLL